MALRAAAHVLKKIQARAERATRPTYKTGLPASTRGAVGRMVAGLRVGGKVKRVNCKILSMELQVTHGKGENKVEI